MRILYIDIDSLRPDHLGCYGYPRNTSPHIDDLARRAVRFENVYVTDAPCLPSRTALWSGRCGFHTGVVGHGGTAGQPLIEGPDRNFRDLFTTTGWMGALRQAGFRTVTVSSFGDRHSAHHWYASYHEIYNPGYGGMDRADQVVPTAIDWIERHGTSDQWFLHVNVWDPHTPYRTPEAFGNPFKDDPLPDWFTEPLRQRAWNGYGPHSPQELYGYQAHHDFENRYPLAPGTLDSMEAVKRWIDAYDIGIRYADDWIGRLLGALEQAGILDETILIVSADHGENQGELNVWGDHQTADTITCRVPLIVRWPGLTDTGSVDRALHYHYDWAATLLELAGGQVPANWDGQPFTEAFRARKDSGRPYVVTSQGAWAVQRGVRFDHDGHAYLALRTYHDGHKMMDPLMLFDLTNDPHEQHNLADERPDLVQKALSLLEDWMQHMMATSGHNVDPLMTVLREGGPFHTRGELPAYLERLRATGRSAHADLLAARHPDEV
ncbi:MAG: sulfatase [Anaerolineae bacterium]|nr:sulfatase [Anaerolineae bacterium]